MPRKNRGTKILNEINAVNKSVLLFGADIYPCSPSRCGIKTTKHAAVHKTAHKRFFWGSAV
jgi:hypothetical protein